MKCYETLVFIITAQMGWDSMLLIILPISSLKSNDISHSYLPTKIPKHRLTLPLEKNKENRRTKVNELQMKIKTIRGPSKYNQSDI